MVRKIGTRYQLIAGERRWRAAQRAQLLRVPVVLREVSEEQALELTLVENIQREDLNPIEQARAFDRLMDEFHLTQDEVASRTGKDRATVANCGSPTVLGRSRCWNGLKKEKSPPATAALCWRSRIGNYAANWRKRRRAES